jgi:hypothetical protein
MFGLSGLQQELWHQHLPSTQTLLSGKFENQQLTKSATLFFGLFAGNLADSEHYIGASDTCSTRAQCVIGRLCHGSKRAQAGALPRVLFFPVIGAEALQVNLAHTRGLASAHSVVRPQIKHRTT